ncbi:MAG: hypothetical protein MZU79_04725 [Anaerotruncus sp.]|nr:hypothetical protein [Anaerotruncus sp.]
MLGFPCREESEHDAYNTGHASTALSAALGMAVARDKAGEKHHVVAVVGDGSLTGGVALEALNQIGHLRERADHRPRTSTRCPSRSTSGPGRSTSPISFRASAISG